MSILLSMGINTSPSSVLQNYLDEDKIKNIYMLPDLLNVEQESDWHPEIWLWEHTKQVCDMSLESAKKYNLNKSESELLLISALMHDIAKKETTKIRFVRGKYRITSYLHPEKGSIKAYNFCKKFGYDDDFSRTVYILVKEHMCHLAFKDGGSQKTFDKVINRLNGVNTNLLYALIEADISGRVANVDDLKLIEVPDLEIMKSYDIRDNT